MCYCVLCIYLFKTIKIWWEEEVIHTVKKKEVFQTSLQMKYSATLQKIHSRPLPFNAVFRQLDTAILVKAPYRKILLFFH